MNPPIINVWALKFHFRRAKVRLAVFLSTQAGAGSTSPPGPRPSPPRLADSSNRAVKPPAPPGLDGLMDLDAVANYAGVHPSTLRRWLRDDRITPPVKRHNRKLYWTEDDAWTIKVENLPGGYHSEIVEPAESDSAGCCRDFNSTREELHP